MDALSLRGIDAYNAGRFDEALGHFRAAIAGGARGPETRCLLAHVLDSAGKPGDAAAEFASVIAAFPSHLPAYDGLAGLALRRGLKGDALKALSRAPALPAGKGKARAALGATLRACASAWLAAGELEPAEKCLYRAARLSPADKEARRVLVELLALRERSGEKKPRRRVPRERPARPEDRRLLLRRLLAEAASDDTPPARIIQEARAAGAGPRQARLHLLAVLRARGDSPAAEKFDDAEKSLRRALALAPRDQAARRLLRDLLCRRAQTRLSAGRLEDAEALLRRALALSPRDRRTRLALAEALRLRAKAAQSAGQRQAALTLYRRVLALVPGDARALFGLGSVLWISGETAEGRRVLARALSLGRAALSPVERFKALMKLGRHKAAIAVAETILDAGARLDDIRTFWDPWEWDERLPRDARLQELRALERAVGADPKTPWLHYYRGELMGPEGLPSFERIASFPLKRYGWMFFKGATAALLAGDYAKACGWYELALAHEPVDWRAHAFLGETLLCLHRPREAYAQMERALSAAPDMERSQVIAWRGAFDLWLGRYEDALVHLEEACRLGAQCAYCWKAGALLKLGRTEEALEVLDDTLKRYPLDFEAFVWRGEAKRRLGRNKEALADLEAIVIQEPGRHAPISLWALVNRALVRRALGDEDGMLSDFRAIAPHVIEHVRKKKKLPLGTPPAPEEMAAVLEAALELSRGFRREEHQQAIWIE